MSVPPDYFSRVIGEVNFPLLQTKRVVVAGVGQVGSKIAAELAHTAVGHLRFVDHDVLERSNLFRHVLPVEYVDDDEPWNKADGLAVYLAAQVAGLKTESVPSRIDGSADDLLDSWLRDADLIIGSTDDPEAQLRIGRRALALEIPAVFPALYPHDNGGDIIVQLDNQFPCFGCAAGVFRTHAPQLEGVGGLSFFGLPVIVTAIKLSLAILERRSEYAKLITPVRNEPPHQVFRLDSAGVLVSRPLEWLSGCPSCGGGGGGSTRLLWTEPPPFVSTPSPENEQLWTNRSSGIRTINREASTGPSYTQPQLQHVPFVGSPASARQPLASQGKPRDRTGTVVIAVIVIIGLFFAIESATSRHLPAEISAPTSIKVNYHQSLVQMIEATHVPPNVNHVPITERQFPVTGGPAEVQVVSIRLTNFKSDDLKATGVLEPANGRTAYLEVQHDLSQLGYRPATLPELLAYIAQASGTQGSPTGVELAGPVYRGEYVTCAVTSRELQCSSVAGGFNQTSEFVAVHK